MLHAPSESAADSGLRRTATDSPAPLSSSSDAASTANGNASQTERPQSTVPDEPPRLQIHPLAIESLAPRRHAAVATLLVQLPSTNTISDERSNSLRYAVCLGSTLVTEDVFRAAKRNCDKQRAQPSAPSAPSS